MSASEDEWESSWNPTPDSAVSDTAAAAAAKKPKKDDWQVWEEKLQLDIEERLYQPFELVTNTRRKMQIFLLEDL